MKELGMNLKTRLAKLEAMNVLNEKPMVILRTMVAAMNGKPVARPIRGWALGQGDQQSAVMRLEGESDLDLETRATRLAFEATPGGKVVRLKSLVDRVDGGAA